MSVSGPVIAQIPVSRLQGHSFIDRDRDPPMPDPYQNRYAEKSLLSINTSSHANQERGFFSTNSSKRGNNSANGRKYDPVHDSGSAVQRPEDSIGERSMSGQSPESARSPKSRVPLPSISQLDFGFADPGRPSERRSPPLGYPVKSPISMSQPFSSPYPSVPASQTYHSVYSESSPSSNHLTQSPRDQYGQSMSSGSPSQYDAQRFRDTAGQTPLSASTQTFSPMSNERSPMTDQRPYSQDGQSPSVHAGGSVAGGYPCTHESCAGRPPFQTQYLLSSHQNVHKPDRPYYCEWPDCSRSKNGKPNSGFKRKNELIRHQLVHNSPGYACPFCPDRDHKYPRPDNLQRHVKVHHADKNKDDPLLRNILAKRADSDAGGRRRRVNSTAS